LDLKNKIEEIGSLEDILERVYERFQIGEKQLDKLSDLFQIYESLYQKYLPLAKKKVKTGPLPPWGPSSNPKLLKKTILDGL
jgi:hypothetical protein